MKKIALALCMAAGMISSVDAMNSDQRLEYNENSWYILMSGRPAVELRLDSEQGKVIFDGQEYDSVRVCGLEVNCHSSQDMLAFFVCLSSEKGMDAVETEAFTGKYAPTTRETLSYIVMDDRPLVELRLVPSQGKVIFDSQEYDSIKVGETEINCSSCRAKLADFIYLSSVNGMNAVSTNSFTGKYTPAPKQ